MFVMKSNQRDMGAHEFEGLVEHSHNVLRCSNCRKPLLDVVVVQPGLDTVSKYRAECPHCPPDERGGRERSFPVVLRGGVIVGLTERGDVIYTGETYLDDLDPGQDLSVLYHTGLIR